MSKMPGRRFTVSVAAELANKIDEHVSNTDHANRSQVVEEALRLWDCLAEYPDKEDVLSQALRLYESQQERELYRSYYAELSADARAEDAGWRQLGEEVAVKRKRRSPTHGQS